MKNIKFSRRQILRTIRAACIALFFAACAGQANAAPTFSADFTVSGSNVTVVGVPNDANTAFFTDPFPNAYAFTILSAANIGNTSNAFHSGNLISFDNGSVNNAGTLTASHYAIVINSTTATSTVSNSYKITSTGNNAVCIFGNGTVNNSAAGVITGSSVSGSYSSVYIQGNGTVNNAGGIHGVYDGVHIKNGSGTVINSGTISGTTDAGVDIGAGGGTVSNTGTISGYYGVYIGGNGTVSNSDLITATNKYGVEIVGDGTVTNAGTGTISTSGNYAAVYIHGAGGASSVTNSNAITGTSSSYYSAGVGFGGTSVGFGASSFSLVNNAGGTISGSATYNGQSVSAYGVRARSYNGNISITNAAGGLITGTATASGYSASGTGISASSSYNGNVTVANSGTATGTGTASGYSGTGTGISASGYNGNVVVTNNNIATGTGTTISSDYTGTGYGISASSKYGNVTVTNNGTATGTGSATYSGYGTGYGISASSNNGTVIVTNNKTATGTGTASGNYSGTGFGIFASSNYGNVTVTNYGTATGSGSSYFNGTSATATGTGISASSKYGTTKIINNGTATGTGSGYYSGTGYGIFSSNTHGGSIFITNNNIATGTGTAAGSGGTPTGTGYGISASSNYGNVTVTNYGTASGTGSGRYSATGSGLYGFTNSGYISILNIGTATGTSTSSYYSGANASVLAYGIYAKTSGSGSIGITNSGAATGMATTGTPIVPSQDPAFGSGIHATSTGSGSIFVNNIGTASGYGTANGSGSGYGYGVNIKSTSSGNVTILNSGVAKGTGSSYSGTGSGYGMYFQNGGTGTGNFTLTNTITGLIQGSGVATSGFSGSGYSYGLYLQNGTGAATLTNSGVITGVNTNTTSGIYSGIGIYAKGYTGPITVNEFGGAVTTGAPTTTGSGPYLPGSIAILLGSSGANTVNILGQSNNTGLIDGGASMAGNNTLTMHLAGMTPAQAAALQTALNNSTGSGYYKAGGVTYSWKDFQHVSGTAVSLEQAVDPGLLDIATKIDNLTSYLGVAYGPFYVAAASNPEGALNSLVGREFDDALGVISKNDATALLDVLDSRAFDLHSGTGGFDLSGLNVMPGSMIASLGATQNTLGRLMGSSALGGTSMSDSKEVISREPAETNRWGAWASGTVTLADESTTATGPGFNYTTGRPTIGADYRVSNHLAVGALLNFSTTGANFADGSRLGVQTGLAALYSTWSDGPWYINGLAGGGISSYDNQRVTIPGAVANSHPDGDEVLADLTGGYDFKLGGGWKVSPEGGFLYTHVTQNGYSETGAGAFDLTYADQNIDSLRSKLGFHVTDNFTWDRIAFTPQFRASWYHEILDDSRGVTTSLGGAPALGSFVVQTNSEGRDFAIVGAGLSATPAELSGDVTFFVNYDAQVGQDNYISHTVNGGLRVNF
jgi:uncharacterized protein YhjY with autotransporter beta-barrel domain